MRFTFPPLFNIDAQVNGNSIKQLLLPEEERDVTLSLPNPHEKARIISYDSEKILVVPKNATPVQGFDKVLRLNVPKSNFSDDSLSDETLGREWIAHPSLSSANTETAQNHKEATESWEGVFNFIEENPAKNKEGLRPPQTGALHAIFAHWTVSNDPATIVLPTGVGKTETMLSLLVSKQCNRVLVIVPTDPLREQISNKFITLGVLKKFGVVAAGAHFPVVGILKHKPKTLQEVDDFFDQCNVIVTTMSIAGQCLEGVQARIAFKCTHLFVDEAHHIAARTWEAFRQRFKNKQIIQFTATPFREDGKYLDGKIIFNYPLKKAQSEGYFKPISFKPIVAFNPHKADAMIAKAAVEQLRNDIAAGYNHILMARAGTIDRATKVFENYRHYAEFNPVLIHSQLPAKEMRETRKKILSKQAKIVVCVDMFGEGFDLPELKIAALHDIHKSLGITLQFTGRFTRSRNDIGNATFIADIGEPKVNDILKELYAQDSDWNQLLQRASANEIGDQVSFRDFLDGFNTNMDEIPMENLRPALSAVVYKTKCNDWTPSNFQNGLEGQFDKIQHVIHHREKILLIVTGRKEYLKWGNIKDIYDWIWNLIIVYWNPDKKLLFIHTADRGSNNKKMAEAVAGEDIEFISGDRVFRSFGRINRLLLQNVGLKEMYGRNIRFTMRVGADVEEGMSLVQKRNSTKSNLFGVGYEDGTKISVGASYKGRIWTRMVGNIMQLTTWCDRVGEKLLDETLNVKDILEGTMLREIISTLPRVMPISIEWADFIYQDTTSLHTLIIAGREFDLNDTDLTLLNPTENGELTFSISTPGGATTSFALELFKDNDKQDYRFRQVGELGSSIRTGRITRPIEEFFYNDPPVFRFADGSMLEGNTYIKLRHDQPPFDKRLIETWDWTGIHLKKESMGETKEADSIQYRVVEKVKNRDFDIVFNDDDKGEAADVIVIKDDDNQIVVEFYHCKFSQELRPGARIKDLYEVCGQAQKSYHWKEKKLSSLITHMMKRESNRVDNGKTSRIEKGDFDKLLEIRGKSQFVGWTLKVFVVQPGLSKNAVSDAQLAILGVTENFLAETCKVKLGVVASG